MSNPQGELGKLITELGLPAASMAEDALILISNRRKNSFYISGFRTF